MKKAGSHTPNSTEAGQTVSELSSFLEIKNATVYSWIKKGKIKAVKQDGTYKIPFEANNEFIISLIKRKHEKPAKMYVPEEIRRYCKWHQTLDEICWLIKVAYAPKDSLKRKSFRIDNLFVRYLRTHKFSLTKLRKVYLSPTRLNSRLITNDLKRGWYNELAYIVPLKVSTLGISFKDIETNRESTSLRYTFSSWRIIIAYYSAYFYLRSVTLQKQPTLKTHEHGAAISAFKHNLLPVLVNVIWKFPLDITWGHGIRNYRKQLPIYKTPHLKYNYANHPRPPHHSPAELFDNIVSTFRAKAKAGRKAKKYMLFDFLHDLRIWANYLEINELLSLWGEGYKGFMDQNLSILLFFIGGVSELSFISVYGEELYRNNLQAVYDLFILNNKGFAREFVSTSIYQRYIIYKKLGYVIGEISLQHETNINEVDVDT